MILNVTKNEYPYYPDVQNNLELPEKDRFTFILQKKSQTLNIHEWGDIKDGGKVNIQVEKYIRSHVKGIENPPQIGETKEGQEPLFLNLDILFSEVYPELFDILEDLFIKIKELNKEVVDPKK